MNDTAIKTKTTKAPKDRERISPTCMITLDPDIRRIAVMNHLENDGPRAMKAYVRDVAMPQYIRLMQAAERYYGGSPDAEDVVDNIIQQWEEEELAAVAR